MADYVWRSEEEKFEAIGFLAIPNVIASIEPTVPRGQKEKFREEYEGKYSEEYPYTADKYGSQFRIYLNDTDGCPDSIKEQLDDTYGNRINNTSFIRELVKEYGFKFIKGPQDSESIKNAVFQKVGRPLYDFYQKGFFTNKYFIKDIDEYFKNKKDLPRPNVLEYKEMHIGKRIEKGDSRTGTATRALTQNQMLMLGWSGEEYIAHLLEEKDEALLQALDISKEAKYSFEWFNDGFQNVEEKHEPLDVNRTPWEFETVKKWEDKSVGEGCDIRITITTGEQIEIEVKTSRGTYPFFNMTSMEMQEMEKMKERYALIRINNFDRILHGGTPDIIPVINPYDKLFHPKQMKEATFIIGGK